MRQRARVQDGMHHWPWAAFSLWRGANHSRESSNEVYELSKQEGGEHTQKWRAFHGVQASLIAQLVKNLPAMQETPVWFLGGEDALEKW